MEIESYRIHRLASPVCASSRDDEHVLMCGANLPPRTGGGPAASYQLTLGVREPHASRMSNPSVPTSPSRWRHLWLPVAWCFGAGLVFYGSTRGPFDPTGRRYGANWPGDVQRALVELTIELVVLYAILRPHSYVASWRRSCVAFPLFLAWTVLGGFASMHAGRVGDYHWLWLLITSVGLFATLIVSASVAVLDRAPAP